MTIFGQEIFFVVILLIIELFQARFNFQKKQFLSCFVLVRILFCHYIPIFRYSVRTNGLDDQAYAPVRIIEQIIMQKYITQLSDSKLSTMV